MDSSDLESKSVAYELINPDIPPLKESDTVGKALGWMEGLRITQLPVIRKGKFVGIVTEDMLFDSNNDAAVIGDLELRHDDIAVPANRHFLDVLKSSASHKVRIVPVEDENDGEFLGVISLKDSIGTLAAALGTQNPGGILVLSMGQFDYSLSEISRLIEENEAKILSSFVESDPMSPQMMKLTLKINQEDLTRIIATLERFGYNVVADYQEPRYDESQSQDRLGLLFRFLDL